MCMGWRCRSSLVVIEPIVDFLDVVIFSGESLASDATTQMVFSSTYLSRRSAVTGNSPALKERCGVRHQIAQELLPDIWTLPPVTMLGRLKSFFAFFRASIQFHLWAKPPSMHASEDPMVAEP